MATFTVSHEEDCAHRTQSGKHSKLRTSLNKSIQEALSNISADDPSTHPLYLNKLNFHALACFLSTLSKTVTRNSSPGSPDDTIIVEGDANANRKVTIRLKPSSYDGVTSSLANLFIECNVSRNINDNVKELWKKVSSYKKGSRHKGARERHELGLSQTEAKSPLSFVTYEYLADILHRSDNPEQIAAHLILLLD